MLGAVAEYSDEEAEEILRRALARERKEGISHEDLIAAAGEVGIDQSDIEAAAAELADERAKLARTDAARGELRRRLSSLASTLLLINALVLGVDVFTGPEWFVQWVALASALLLGARALKTFMPSEDDLQRVERRLSRRERRRQRAHERRQRRKQPKARGNKSNKSRTEAEFERVVEQGVEALLRSAADRIERWNQEQRQQGQPGQQRPRVRVESAQAAAEGEGADVGRGRGRDRRAR